MNNALGRRTRRDDAFTYDEDGNLLSDGRFTYTWNAENRLIEVQSRTGILPVIHAEYKYDFQGRRVSMTVNGVETIFVWDGWNILHETSNSATNNYVWGLDLSGTLQGAGGVGGLVAATLSGSNVFYCVDGNGNVSDLIDDAGTIVAHYEYDPFGNQVVATGSLSNVNPWRFSSKYWEPESGLLHYELRPYFPCIGMWGSRDPIGEKGGVNEYGFVRNNPVSNYDKLGLYTLDDARKSLEEQRVAPAILATPDIPNGLGYMPGISARYSDKQIFEEWLKLEQRNKGFWESLEKCPKRLCFGKKKMPINPDSKTWATPSKLHPFLRWKYHPGGFYEMRTAAAGHGNQCIYDEDGRIMKDIPAAGTADLFSPNSGGFSKHQTHDVQTFDLSKKLNRIPDYYSVRGIWAE